MTNPLFLPKTLFHSKCFDSPSSSPPPPPPPRSNFSLTHAIILHMRKTNLHRYAHSEEEREGRKYYWINEKTTCNEFYCKVLSTTEYFDESATERKPKELNLFFSLYFYSILFNRNTDVPFKILTFFNLLNFFP